MKSRKKKAKVNYIKLTTEQEFLLNWLRDLLIRRDSAAELLDRLILSKQCYDSKLLDLPITQEENLLLTLENEIVRVKTIIVSIVE